MDKLISTQKAEFKAECEKEREETRKILNRYRPRNDFDYEEEVRKANSDKAMREFLRDLYDQLD